MTEAIISDLARIRALRVISRTSAMQYKGTELSLPEIARELNVDAVLEGSALLVGNRVRLSVQLDLGARRRDALGRPLRPRARGRPRPAERARRDRGARDRDPADADGGDPARASAHAGEPGGASRVPQEPAFLLRGLAAGGRGRAAPRAARAGARPDPRAGLVRARGLPRLPRAPRDGAAGRGLRRGHGRGDQGARAGSVARRCARGARRDPLALRATSPAACAPCRRRSS